MSTNDLINAQIKALESETAKNFAEQQKLEKEAEEIRKKLEKEAEENSRRVSFLGISLGSIIKYIIAGLAGGALLWSISLDYVFKVTKVNIELKEKLEKDNDKLKQEKQKLSQEKEKFKVKAIELDNTVTSLQKQLSDITTKPSSEEKSKELNNIIVKEVHQLETAKYSFGGEANQAEKSLKPGWVYLGEYENGKWKTRYFNFQENLAPKEIIGKEIVPLVKSINVRTEKFDGDIISVLYKSDSVKVTKVENYPFTDYVWAEFGK